MRFIHDMFNVGSYCIHIGFQLNFSHNYCNANKPALPKYSWLHIYIYIHICGGVHMHVFICRYTCIYIIFLYTQMFFNNCLFLSIHPHVLILLDLCKSNWFRTFSYLPSHNLVTLQDVFLHYLLATLGLVAALEKQSDTWCRLDFSWGLFSHLQGGFWPPLGCWCFSPDNPQQSILQMIMKRWRKGCRACGRKERSRCRKVEWWYLIAVQMPNN